jgi:hypothetical protein
MIRLGSLAGYPFEGPRLLAGWTPPAKAAVYAIMYRPGPETRSQEYAVIYVDHSDDLSLERFPFSHPRASCWTSRAGDRWRVLFARSPTAHAGAFSGRAVEHISRPGDHARAGPRGRSIGRAAGTHDRRGHVGGRPTGAVERLRTPQEAESRL